MHVLQCRVANSTSFLVVSPPVALPCPCYDRHKTSSGSRTDEVRAAPVWKATPARDHNTCRRCYRTVGRRVRRPLTVADRTHANFVELRHGEVLRISLPRP